MIAAKIRWKEGLEIQREKMELQREQLKMAQEWSRFLRDMASFQDYIAGMLCRIGKG